MLYSTKVKIGEMIYRKIDDHIRVQHRVAEPPKECEVCGCLLGQSAVKGESVVRERNVSLTYAYPMSSFTQLMEYIFTPYYCKIHAPKEEG